MSFLQQFITGLTNKIIVGAITAVGMIFQAGPGIDGSVPAIRLKDNRGRTTWEAKLSGDQSGSGNLLAKSGSTAAFFVDTRNRRVGIGTASPETALEVIGTDSGRVLHAQDRLESSGSIVARRSLYSDNVKISTGALVTTVCSSQISTVPTSNCDAITDGVADDTEIRSAITTASGGTIFVRRGIYNFCNPITISAVKRVHILGERGTIFQIPESCLSNFGFAYMLQAGDALGDNVTIENITFNGQYSVYASHPANQGGGVAVGKNWHLLRNVFRDFNYFGLWLGTYGADVKVLNNTFDGPGNGSDHIGGGGSTRVEIAGNTWEANIAGNAWDNTSGTNFDIHDNVVKGTGCFYVEAMQYVNVHDNHFPGGGCIGVGSDKGYSPAAITNSRHVRVANNTMSGGKITFTFSSDVAKEETVSGNFQAVGNHVINPFSYGILFHGNDEPAAWGNGNLVANNTIDNPNMSNAASMNTGNGIAAPSGINIMQGFDVNVAGNIVTGARGTQGYGIQIGQTFSASATNEANHVRVSGNEVRGFGSGSVNVAAPSVSNDVRIFHDGMFSKTSLGQAETGAVLEIMGTASGRVFRAQDMLLSSGALVVNKRVGSSTGNTLIVDTKGLVYDASNKRVGIGTASPGSPLNIVDAYNLKFDAGEIKEGTAGSPHRIRMRSDSNLDIVADSTNGRSIKLNAGGSDRITVLSTGLVGIGTTVPENVLEIIGTASGRILRAQDTLASSGTLVVKGSTTLQGALTVRAAMSGASLAVSNLRGCDTMDTDSAGNLSCGSDAGIAALNSSTGALANSFKNIFLASSTGAVKSNFGSQFVQSSTGSLRILFNSLYFQSSTGSLANAFKTIFLASSTGSLKTNFGSQFIQSSTGALKASFGSQFIQSSTGALKASFASQFVQSSTGSLRATLYGFGQGLTRTAEGLVTLGSTITGSIVRVTSTIRSSGSLVVRGATTLSGGLTIFKPAGLGTGNLLVIDTKGLIYDGTNKRVGIGTATPGQKLVVGNDLTTLTSANAIAVGDTVAPTLFLGKASNDYVQMFYNSNGFNITTNEAGTTYNPTMNIHAGKVGISKVTSPGSALSVSGAVIISAQGTLGTKSADAGLALEVIGTMSGRILRAQDTLATSGALVIHNYAGTSTGNLLVVDSKGLVYDGTNKRVGIGTSSPDTALEIVGTLSGSSVYITGSGSSPLFYTTTAANGFGRIGIGTNSPSAPLHVASTASPGLQVGNGTSGNFKLGDATLTKASGSNWTFNDNGVTGLRNLNVGTANTIVATTFNVFNKLGAGVVLSIFQGQAGQTADLMQWQNAGSNVLSYISASGSGSLPGLVLGGAAFETGLKLEIAGTASGRILRAQDTLASSGGLVVRNNATFQTSLLLTPQASAPGSPTSGMMYMDSTPAPDELCVYDGAAWQALISGTDANCA